MRKLPMFALWLRVAEYLLDREDVVRIIRPTIADALHERPAAENSRSWLWRSRFSLAFALSGALRENIVVRFRGASWLGFCALLLAGLSSAANLKVKEQAFTFASSQCLFVGIGAVLAMVIIGTPAQLLRSIGSLLQVVALVAFALCPRYGVAFNGQRQWLQFHSVQIHIATLFLPVFSVFAHRVALERRYARLGVGSLVVLILIGLQPNWEAGVTYLATVVFALFAQRARWFDGLLKAVLVITIVASVARVSAASPWSTLSVTALVLALGREVFGRLSRQHAHSSPARTLTMAMVALTAFRALNGDTLPVVGFGGSAVVAFFAMIALQMRAGAGRIEGGQRAAG